MSFLMPKPKLPQIAAPPAMAAPPERADPAIAQALKDEREARARRKGRGALILTSGLGDVSEPNVNRPRLLGQVGAP